MSDDDGRGVERVRSLRDLGVRLPVIAVMMNKDAERLAALLDAGADDVVCRPFHPREIVGRVHAITRRTYGHVSAATTVGGITAYFDGRDPVIDGTLIKLSVREHEIFTIMAADPEGVHSRAQIYDTLYGLNDDPPFDKCVCVQIHKLRKKLRTATGRECIETVYGRGYRLIA